MQKCPKCGSEVVHRSRTRNQWELWRKEITGKRPYRCHACDWRGWDVDRGPQFDQDEIEIATEALAPDPPNLKGTSFARPDPPSVQLDLEKLDTLSPIVRRRRADRS